MSPEPGDYTFIVSPDRPLDVRIKAYDNIGILRQTVDNAGSPFLERLTLDVLEPSVFFVVVDSVDGTSGNYEIILVRGS